MSNKEQIDKAFELMRERFAMRCKLLLCGNGGSAADCEHIVGELMKGMNLSRKIDKFSPLQYSLPAISLCSQVGLITAIGNDIGWDWIFAQQIYAYGKPGDILMAISTSGKSTNILTALSQARKMNFLGIIGLVGPYTDKFEKYCDVVISVAADTTAEIQEGHIKIYHELCTRLEKEFFSENRRF